MAEQRKYEQLSEIDRAAVERALIENDPERLLRVVLSVAMFDDDPQFIQDLCVRLSRHTHATVRANAILGFGHAARRFRHLDRDIVQPIIQSGLEDDDPFVQGQAAAAKVDTMHFLKWAGYRSVS